MDGTLGQTLGISALMSVCSGHVAGLIGALAMTAFGPQLGMAAAIWTGATTEPVFSDLVFPWWMWGVGMVTTLVGMAILLRESRTPTGPAIGMFLASTGAIICAILPFLHLARLTQAAGG